MVTQDVVKNSGACGQRRRFKENRNKKDTYAVTVDVCWSNNENRGLGEFGTLKESETEGKPE